NIVIDDLGLAGCRIGVESVFPVFLDNIVADDDPAGSLESKAAVAIPNHDIVLDTGVQRLRAPGEYSGPAIPVDHVVINLGEPNRGADSGALIVEYPVVMDVR